MLKVPILTWQSVLTDHQAFTYEALENLAQTQVISYVVATEDKDRKKQGWLDSQVGSITRFLIPKDRFFNNCLSIIRKNRNSIHIFAAPFTDWRFAPCMVYAALLKVEYYIISEPYSPHSEGYLSEVHPLTGKVKAFLRPYLYRLYGLILGKSTAGVFVISQLAYRQFHSAGFQACNLFRFGYFVPRQHNRSTVTKDSLNDGVQSTIKAIFVGSLIKRKGADLLFGISDALGKQGSKISIDVYGPGNLDSLPVNLPNFNYKGVIPFGDAQKVMSQYDLALVPSRHDGWGVVVNEAILAGIPVICSDQVGASALIDRFNCGLKFRSGDTLELLSILTGIENSPTLLRGLRDGTVRAGQFIEPSVAASYMLSVIKSPPSERAMIDSPWY